MKTLRLLTLITLSIFFSLENTFAQEDTITCAAMFSVEQDFELLVQEGQMKIDFKDYSFAPDEIVSWTWDFGDGASSSKQNPAHTYDEAGEYEVLLTIQTATCETVGGTYFYVYSKDEYESEQPDADECEALFEAFPGDSVNTYSFLDASFSGSEITSWTWNFGDGSTSTEREPEHIYTSAGEYTVTLLIASDECNDTTSMVITVGDFNNSDEEKTCQASFDFMSGIDSIYSDNVQVDKYTFNFIDFSSSPSEITSWYWDFGDGTTSTAQNPVHTYSQTGDYNVVLSISSDDCESSFEEMIYITMDSYDDDVDTDSEVEECEAAFTYTVYGDSVVFEDNSTYTGDMLMWFWDFGDGESSYEQNPSHVYTEAGEYQVILGFETNECGNSVVDTITIGRGVSNLDDEQDVCEALFTYTVYGDSVVFEDNSTYTGDMLMWDWDFGDGTSSNEQNPTHIYEEEGEYKVIFGFETNECGDAGVDTISIYNDVSESDSQKGTAVSLLKSSVSELMLYPNPVSNTSIVLFYSKTDGAQIVSVYNLSGRLVQSENVLVETGQNSLSIDLSLLRSGSYIMRISGESINFIKQ